MAEVTNQLIFDVLRTIQSDLSHLKEGQREIRQELIAIRGHITAMQADISNLYSVSARLELRFDRLERSVGFIGEPAE
jgi:hypothetical protein